MPIPEFVWRRIVGFLVRGNYGRVELDVMDGRIVQCRIIESIKVSDDDLVRLREPA